MMDYSDVGRLALALLLGGAIGFERRWHGHAAGPHTNALVAFGAALFVLMGHDLGGDATARIAAQVATGIGFLAAGVIMRDGFRVRGLNTAATIWCVAAMGCFVGLRYIWLPLAATILILAANTVFHIIEHRIPQLADVEEGGEH
ncbi:MgtC/SapB family protein [Aestuariivirga sp.]|uniref:MgtC/SapB family protein n=1 Tax=Aestuariivirga sp. TaxID=2650926 RepID=UPI0039E63C38